MSKQKPLFKQDIWEAIEACVIAAGGRQEVGDRLWPEMQDPPEAGKKLGRCLNTSHQEKLSVEQFLFILKLARDVNCHVGMDYIASKCNYKYEAFEPEDERANLQREFISLAKPMSKILKRLEQLDDE